MDIINFKTSEDFPMYREALIRLQNMSLMLANLTELGGTNYILSGCKEDKSGNISEGFVVINGKLMPFRGGKKRQRIKILETRKDVIAEIKNPPFEKVYHELYIDEVAEFANDGEIFWDDFERVESLLQLAKKIRDIRGDAPGTIKMWAGSIAMIPQDYMLCDGQPLLTKDYNELFQTIGASFGGDGTANFKLPDLRGRFIVGYDSKYDSDYNAIGLQGGEKKVALKTENLPAHDHRSHSRSKFDKLSARAADIDSTNTPGSADSNKADEEYRVAGMNVNQWDDATIQLVGENKPHENRPPYFTLAYIIKVR